MIHTIGDEPAVGLCGSGLIDAIAAARTLGACDETGCLKDESFRLTEEADGSDGDVQAAAETRPADMEGRAAVDVCSADVEGQTAVETRSKEIVLTQEDIRAVQMAKGAIAAGIETLLDEAGITAEAVGSFWIAGGFGSHLNIESTASIGLFPRSLAARAKVLGNASLQGAALLLLNQNEQKTADRIAGLARHVDLGGNPKFNERYIECMMF